MTHFPKLFICLLTLTGAALAQNSVNQSQQVESSSSSPVAYVYVSRPTHIDGFAAASDGKLTAVPGSPFEGTVSHMSVTSKYLFGAGDNQEDIYSYYIGSKGQLSPATVNDVQQYNTNGCKGTFGPTQVDFTGTSLYSLVNTCSGVVTVNYKIHDAGRLSYDEGFYTQIDNNVAPLNPIRLLGTNNFAYQTGCDSQDYGVSTTNVLERASDGSLSFIGRITGSPEPSSPASSYCSFMLATDPTNHLAFAFREYTEDAAGFTGPYYLASYTANESGDITTDSDYATMPPAQVGTVTSMSISPSGKLLAVGGMGGLQVFHFNGSSPITAYTGLITENEILQLGWDKANHLYALGPSELFVYTVTSDSVKEATGSPYVIPEASSVIVLDLK